MSQSSLYAHGKLLITGEYAVLKGAEALAVPLRKGQHFTFRKMRGSDLHWKCLRPDGKEWFKGVFSLLDFSAQEHTDAAVAAGITQILTGIARQNPDFLADWKGQAVECRLEFEPEWGLGSSATLVHALAEWGEADPWTLLEQTFGGSGYDLACAGADGPLLYQSTEEEIRITPYELEWPFRDQLLLVWSGRKENSRDSIRQHGEALAQWSAADTRAFTSLTDTIAGATDLDVFIGAMQEHNLRLSTLLNREPVPHFPDFPGLIKPLGAWGGDFFLAASAMGGKEMKKWFAGKGMSTSFSWKDLVLEES